MHPREVWKLTKDRIQDSKEGFLLVDDSIQDKRYSHFMELVRAQDSGNEPRVLKGIGVVNLVPRGRIAPRGAARAQVPRSAARRVPVSGWAAQSPAAGGR